MKRFLVLIAGLFTVIGFNSLAEAINITNATVSSGTATISGDHAARSASITWEGLVVDQSSNGGGFTFTTTKIPSDCIGSLSDGVATIDVALTGCTPPAGGVLKTGQTRCWDSAGLEIACAGTGQDGDLQKGVARSYTDNGNGTITDNVTGLIWEKLDNLNFAADFSNIHDADNNYSTSTSAFQKITDLNTANFAGNSDWRLPNVKELQSLVFFGRSAPAIDSAFNNGTDSFTRITGTYWSSTTFPSVPGQAWGVSFTVGGSVLVFKTSATNFFVRAVRGPVATGSTLFQSAGFAPVAKTINITEAAVISGMATVSGDHAAKSALITWEGIVVAQSSKGGTFIFTTANIPADCIGSLSDGVATIEVPLNPCTPPSPPTAKVLKTGQTQCWDSAGAEMPCAGTGQDGEFQIGVAQSYTDNGDGTITDNQTGLMWEKLGNHDYVANFSDPHDVDNNTYTWAQAFQKIADLNAANFAGYSDWRLPNIMELESLPVFGKVTSRLPGPEIPAVDQVFDNGTDSFTRSNGYTSSTTSLSLPSWANGVNFLHGGVFPTLFKTTPFANGSVRAVRDK